MTEMNPSLTIYIFPHLYNSGLRVHKYLTQRHSPHVIQFKKQSHPILSIAIRARMAVGSPTPRPTPSAILSLCERPSDRVQSAALRRAISISMASEGGPQVSPRMQHSSGGGRSNVTHEDLCEDGDGTCHTSFEQQWPCVQMEMAAPAGHPVQSHPIDSAFEFIESSLLHRCYVFH
ncbi:hypothetical protein CC1G_08435 [Coprinopsis cinerea okayama7|uniref:Uncharacterized protein n=1 Tax=Coprinopsis cinerea (strain Okayama-7 / 130 / ATCC MYA-4618 / FGSC 9003) TaxID=240176 RepID=A8NAR6_COPC7|nr:hypothetical protein CC1G_08435 [Coprinopsis cinerea okayama7\|eukprot:XP_001831918.2 hypothetical protein CC1G_08435 [Coprinopsis cinerea okayama7\